MLVLSSVFSPASKEIEDNTISLWSLAEESFCLTRKLATEVRLIENLLLCFYCLFLEPHKMCAGIQDSLDSSRRGRNGVFVELERFGIHSE
eukprot:g1604.t1